MKCKCAYKKKAFLYGKANKNPSHHYRFERKRPKIPTLPPTTRNPVVKSRIGVVVIVVATSPTHENTCVATDPRSVSIELMEGASRFFRRRDKKSGRTFTPEKREGELNPLRVYQQTVNRRETQPLCDL